MNPFPKLLLLFCIIFFSQQYCGQVQSTYQNSLLNHTWGSFRIIGINPQTPSYKIVRAKPEQLFAGNAVRFIDSTNFWSGYVAPCGNDYFTSVSGKYKFIANDKIAFSVDSVYYFGSWTKPTEYRATNYVIYEITQSADTLFFTKQD
jgi:hypothetical protein